MSVNLNDDTREQLLEVRLCLFLRHVIFQEHMNNEHSSAAEKSCPDPRATCSSTALATQERNTVTTNNLSHNLQ